MRPSRYTTAEAIRDVAAEDGAAAGSAVFGSKGDTVSAASVAAAGHIVVHAGAGADTLTGGFGNDVLYAGGDTTMTGGTGANKFIFETAARRIRRS